MIYNYIYPNTIVKTAGVVAMGAISMINRPSGLLNYGYGEDLQSMLEIHEQSSLENNEQSSFADDLRISFANTIEKLQEEHIDEEMGTLNRKRQKYLSKLYEKNEEIKELIINLLEIKKELDLKEILDRRYKNQYIQYDREGIFS